MKVYVVLLIDRHCDPCVSVHETEKGAQRDAKLSARYGAKACKSKVREQAVLGDYEVWRATYAEGCAVIVFRSEVGA